MFYYRKWHYSMYVSHLEVNLNVFVCCIPMFINETHRGTHMCTFYTHTYLCTLPYALWPLLLFDLKTTIKYFKLTYTVIFVFDFVPFQVLISTNTFASFFATTEKKYSYVTNCLKIISNLRWALKFQKGHFLHQESAVEYYLKVGYICLCSGMFV